MVRLELSGKRGSYLNNIDKEQHEGKLNIKTIFSNFLCIKKKKIVVVGRGFKVKIGLF